jgi:SAM-dependent methyltransferase
VGARYERERNQRPSRYPEPVSERDAIATARLFQHQRVADGYASARPYLHPEIFALVREQLGVQGRLGRALDVGCGTGLSSLALRALSRQVVGADASLEMLRRAGKAPGVSYAAATGEALPFREGAFDLIVACGSLDWIDRTRFLPSAAAILAAGGFVVGLDFGDSCRSPELPGLERWHQEVFLQRFPRPHAADPMITDAEASANGFTPPAIRAFESSWPFSAVQYAAFLMTESSVSAAVEYGSERASDVRAWLDAQLLALFGDGTRRVGFTGYVQALRKVVSSRDAPRGPWPW